MKSRGLPASSTSVGPLAGAGPIVIESVCARTEPSRRTPNLSPKATGRSRICDSLVSQRMAQERPLEPVGVAVGVSLEVQLDAVDVQQLHSQRLSGAAPLLPQGAVAQCELDAPGVHEVARLAGVVDERRAAARCRADRQRVGVGADRAEQAHAELVAEGDAAVQDLRQLVLQRLAQERPLDGLAHADRDDEGDQHAEHGQAGGAPAAMDGSSGGGHGSVRVVSAMRGSPRGCQGCTAKSGWARQPATGEGARAPSAG